MRRWQPVTQSARSRQSCGQIEDCEQSNSTIHRINLCPVVSAIGFPNSYPLDNVIYLLNNWGVMISNEVSVTLCIMVKSQRFFCLFTGWVNQVSHFVKVINIKIFDLFKCKRKI